MTLLLSLAGAIGFLFLFFLASDYTETNDHFVYLQYMCILLVFFFLGMGVKEYIDSNRETKRRSYELKSQKKAARKQRIRDRFNRF